MLSKTISSPSVSVLTCTRNPRGGLLQRVVDALAAQTLPRHEWEYVVVNSASTYFPGIDWSPNLEPRIIKEPLPGKIRALLAGLATCRGEMIVIVDDDNVLDANYLAEGWRIFEEMPFLGVWGGSIIPEFEVAPDPQWMEYTPLLTHYEVQRVTWSNFHLGPAPAGAGMCLRRPVADKFAENVRAKPELCEMGRTGAALPGVDDWEMAMSACDLGLGMGKFPSPRLTHLIPKERVEFDYLLRMQENSVRAYQAYTSARPELFSIKHCRESRWRRLHRCWEELHMSPVQRAFRRAFRRGLRHVG
jgi:hypothetical protein